MSHEQPSQQPPFPPQGQPGGPPPYAGQYPGQPYQQGYAPRPPKKSHTLRNVLLIIGALLVLLVGGCTAVLVAGGNAVNNAVEEAEASANAPAAPPAAQQPAAEQDDTYGDEKNPVTLTKGKAFDIRGFKYAAGWKIADDGLGSATVEKLKVTNGRGREDSALIEIKLWQGSEIVAAVDCSSDGIAPGTTVTLSCFGTDDLPTSYDKVTINDSF